MFLRETSCKSKGENEYITPSQAQSAWSHVSYPGGVSTLCLGRLLDLSRSPELMGLEKRPRNSSWSEAMN